MVSKTKKIASIAAAAILACTLAAGVGLVSAQAEEASAPQETAENFVASSTGWDTPSAAWDFSDGKATGSGTAFLADFATMDYQETSYNYTLSATFAITEGMGTKEIGFGIVPWAQDADNFILVSMKWTNGTPFSLLVQRRIGGIWYGAEGVQGTAADIPWNEVQFAGTTTASISSVSPVTMTVQRTYNASTGMDEYVTTIEGQDAGGKDVSTTFPVQSFSQSAGSGGKIGLYAFNHPIDVTSFTADLGDAVGYEPFTWFVNGSYHMTAQQRNDITVTGNTVAMDAESTENHTRFYMSSGSSEAYEDVTFAGSLAFDPSGSAEGAEYGLYLNYIDDDNNVRLVAGEGTLSLIEEAYGQEKVWTAQTALSGQFSVHMKSSAVTVVAGETPVAFTAQIESGASEPADGAVTIASLENFDGVNVGAFAKGGTLTVSNISVTDTFASNTPLEKNGWTVYGAREGTWTVSEDGKTVSNSLKKGGTSYRATNALTKDALVDATKGYYVGAAIKADELNQTDGTDEWKFGLVPYYYDNANFVMVWLSQWEDGTPKLCINGLAGGRELFTMTWLESDITVGLQDVNYLEAQVLPDGTLNVYLNRAFTPTASTTIAALDLKADAYVGVNSFNVGATYSEFTVSEERIFTAQATITINIPASFPTTGTVGKAVNLGVITASLEGDGGIAPTPVITVTGPDNEEVELNGVRFTPEKEGTYTVTITATDSWGNSATETKKIVVSAAGGPQGGSEENDGEVESEGGQPLTGGAIAGIAIAAVVVAAGIGVGVFFLVKKKKK